MDDCMCVDMSARWCQVCESESYTQFDIAIVMHRHHAIMEFTTCAIGAANCCMVMERHTVAFAQVLVSLVSWCQILCSCTCQIVAMA